MLVAGKKLLLVELLLLLAVCVDCQDVVEKKVVKIENCPANCTCVLTGVGASVKCLNADISNIPVLPSNVIEIHLENNNISKITKDDLAKYKRLNDVKLIGNRIKFIEVNAFDNQVWLRRLTLKGNPLKNFSIRSLGKAKKILKLLNLAEIDADMFPLLNIKDETTSLKALSLQGNNIKEFDPLQIPDSLENLDLSCNNIYHLDVKEPGKYLFSNLFSLHVRGCRDQEKISLHTVARSFFDATPNLKHLDLSGNRMQVIPTNLPKPLATLQLNNNEIVNIKKGECASEMEIKSDFISRVQTTGDEDDLDMDDYYHEIGDVGSELSNLVLLETLDLSDNFIDVLCQDDFLYMETLLNLNLSNNNVAEYNKTTFPYIRSLQILDFSSNLLTNLQIPENPDLKELYVQKNSIQTVESFDRKTKRGLERADFSDNDFTCDCNLINFWEFLMFSAYTYIPHFAGKSDHFLCSRPSRVAGQRLNSMRKSTLTCEVAKTTLGIPIWAIAVPAAAFLLIVLATVLFVVARRRKGKKVCCCGGDEKVPLEHRDIDLVAMRRKVKEVAIFCHEQDHQWVLNPVVSRLEQFRKQLIQQQQLTGMKRKGYTPLNINLFTIGQNIKIDLLHHSVEKYRKIVLIITHEFLNQDTCVYVTSVIADYICSTPKDAVLVVFADTLGWEDLPKELKILATEKTFVEFPSNSRLQETFWENFCSQVNKITDDDEGKNLRNSSGGVMSKERAARLKRLGITANGQISTSIKDAVEQAQQKDLEANSTAPPPYQEFGSRKSSKNVSINDKASVKEFVPLERRATKRSVYELESDEGDFPPKSASMSAKTVSKRIEEESRRKIREMERMQKSANSAHSLLPPCDDDVESVYSNQDDSHDNLPKNFRPRGRSQRNPTQRPLPQTPLERSLSRGRRASGRAFDPVIRRSPEENLHGVHRNGSRHGSRHSNYSASLASRNPSKGR